MPKPTDLYTLAYIDNGTLRTLEFSDKALLEKHIAVDEAIKPDSDDCVLLLNGREVSWTTKTTIEIANAQPLEEVAKKPRRPRRTRAQIEADEQAKAEAKRKKLNGSTEAAEVKQ